jgi:hypothetical protein
METLLHTKGAYLTNFKRDADGFYYLTYGDPVEYE